MFDDALRCLLVVGSVSRPFEAVCRRFWYDFGRFWAILGDFKAILGYFGLFSAILQLYWATVLHLGRLWLGLVVFGWFWWVSVGFGRV